MVYKIFGKKSNGRGVSTVPNYQLVNEIQRQILRIMKRRKVYSSFKDKNWGVGLVNMQSLRQ